MLNAKDARAKAMEQLSKLTIEDTNSLINKIEYGIEINYLQGKLKYLHLLEDCYSRIKFPKADLKLVFKHFRKSQYKIRKSYISKNVLVVKW